MFTVLVSAGGQFNFADSDYNLPKNWKKRSDKIISRTLFLSPAFFKEAKIHFAALIYTKPPDGCGVCYELEDAEWLSALPRHTRSWKAVTVTWSRTSYLSQRVAEAGSQCKCSCCLHHPLVAGSGHPRHIWHSLHSGLSHLSQSLCQLSPAWKDSKHQDFFGVWLEPELEPTMVQPNLQQLLQIPFCGQFPVSGPCALSANSNCTLSQIRKPLWTKQTFSIASWSEIPPVPPGRHKAGREKVENQWPGVCRIASFSVSTDLHQLEIFKTWSTAWQSISYISMITNPWISIVLFPTLPKSLTMKTAHGETHHSHGFFICKLPREYLLSNVLGCPIKDKHASLDVEGDTDLFPMSKVLHNFLYWQINKLPPLQVGLSKHVTSVWVSEGVTYQS